LRNDIPGTASLLASPLTSHTCMDERKYQRDF